MPKALVTLVGLSLLVLTVFPVFAQDSATPSSARKQLLEKNLETRKEKIANKIATIKETQASREAILRTKLQAFKNQKKASAAARINTNLNQINQKQVEQMQKHLETMSQILDRLEARVNQGAPDIKDPVSAKAAIASAREAWASASAAIVTQSQKDYTIKVTSEAKVREDAKTLRDALHADLLALRKTVLNTKQAISNAIKVAKSNKEATSSGQQ